MRIWSRIRWPKSMRIHADPDPEHWLRIQDPVPFWPLDPGSRMGFFPIPDPGSRILNPYIFESLVTILWVKSTRILCKLALFFYFFTCSIHYIGGTRYRNFWTWKEWAKHSPCLWRHNLVRGRWGERAWWQRQPAAAGGHGWQCSSRRTLCPRHSRTAVRDIGEEQMVYFPKSSFILKGYFSSKEAISHKKISCTQRLPSHPQRHITSAEANISHPQRLNLIHRGYRYFSSTGDTRRSLHLIHRDKILYTEVNISSAEATSHSHSQRQHHVQRG